MGRRAGCPGVGFCRRGGIREFSDKLFALGSQFEMQAFLADKEENPVVNQISQELNDNVKSTILEGLSPQIVQLLLAEQDGNWDAECFQAISVAFEEVLKALSEISNTSPSNPTEVQKNNLKAAVDNLLVKILIEC